jgi:hypothetical protein
MGSCSFFSADVTTDLFVDETEQGNADEVPETSANPEESGEPSSSSEPMSSTKSQSDADSSGGYSPALQPPRIEFVDLSYKRKAVEFRRSGKKKLRSLESTMKCFPRLTSRYMYRRWARAVDKEGKSGVRLLNHSSAEITTEKVEKFRSM